MIRRSPGPLLAAALVTVLVPVLAGCTATAPEPQAARKLARPAAPSAASSTAPAAGTCRWNPVAAANQASIKDVGTPPTTVTAAGAATMTLTTNLGAVEIVLDAKATPCTVASFAHLAGKKFFDGSPCHRLTTTRLFVLQCGDPSGTGTGGPAYQYAEENLGTRPGYLRGSVAVARAQDPGTNGSQFFINYDDNLLLAADYTRFGRVSKGLDVIDKVAAGGVTPVNDVDDGTPKISITLQQVTVVYG
jgi:peptidyl-prolyl cis-trans isomerase B (cyclophilin B)